MIDWHHWQYMAAHMIKKSAQKCPEMCIISILCLGIANHSADVELGGNRRDTIKQYKHLHNAHTEYKSPFHYFITGENFAKSGAW